MVVFQRLGNYMLLKKKLWFNSLKSVKYLVKGRDKATDSYLKGPPNEKAKKYVFYI